MLIGDPFLSLNNLFILFNASLLFGILLIMLLPVAVLGGGVFLFLAKITSIIGLMLLLLFLVNLYYLKNRKLFLWLEQENWPEIKRFLQSEIYGKNRFKSFYIQLLSEVAIRLDDLNLLIVLRKELQQRGRCRLLSRFALELGLPYLLEDLGEKSELYFGEVKEYKFLPFKVRCWSGLFYGIALLMQDKADYGLKELDILLHQKNSGPLIHLICIQLLEEFARLDENLIRLRKTELRKQYHSTVRWNSYMRREQCWNVGIPVIRELISSAYRRHLAPVHETALEAESLLDENSAAGLGAVRNW